MQNECIQSVLHGINAQRWMILKVILSTSCRMFFMILLRAPSSFKLSVKTWFITLRVKYLLYTICFNWMWPYRWLLLSYHKCRGQLYMCSSCDRLVIFLTLSCSVGRWPVLPSVPHRVPSWEYNPEPQLVLCCHRFLEEFWKHILE